MLVPTPIPEPNQILEIPDNPIYIFISGSLDGYVCNTVYLNVYENILAHNTFLYDAYGQPVLLLSGAKIKVHNAVRVDGTVYYQISYDDQISGYVRAEYVYVGSQLPDGVINPWKPGQTPGIDVTPTPTPTPVPQGPDMDFETRLIMEDFRSHIRML